MCFPRADEIDVCYQDTNPSKEPELRNQINKVIEDVSGIADGIHIGEQTETSAQTEGIDRHTPPIRFCEDGGGFPLHCETVDCTAGNVEVGVCGAEDKEEDAAV